jgi:hypothetical protein
LASHSPPNTYKICSAFSCKIKSASTAKTLDRLRVEVTDGDVVDREKNKESAALKSYNTTIQRYSMIYKQFMDMLPKAPAGPDGKLYDFIKQV